MKNEHNYKLIDGIFQPIEAQNLLLELIDTKINFHNRDAFSNHIRFNSNILNDVSRTKKLKITSEEMKRLIQFAASNNYELEIKSNISITLKHV